MKKIIDYILLCFVLQTICSTSSVYAEKLSSGKVYIIRSAMNNDYVIDVQNHGSSNGTNIQLHHYSDTRAQKFIIQSVKDGYCKIIDKNSGKVIDVRGGIAGNEVNIHLWEQNGTDAQMFKFEEAGNGYYYIRNKLGYYIDAYGAQCRDGVNIQTYRKNGGQNQKWLFTAIPNNIIEVSQENNSEAEGANQTKSKTGLKLISIENHLTKRLKRYITIGLFLWIASFFVIIPSLGKKFNVSSAMNFILWSIIVAVSALILYYLAIFVWRNIILPILTAIAWLFGLVLLAGSNNGKCGHPECPFYPQYRSWHCDDCEYR